MFLLNILAVSAEFIKLLKGNTEFYLGFDASNTFIVPVEKNLALKFRRRPGRGVNTIIELENDPSMTWSVSDNGIPMINRESPEEFRITLGREGFHIEKDDRCLAHVAEKSTFEFKPCSDLNFTSSLLFMSNIDGVRTEKRVILTGNNMETKDNLHSDLKWAYIKPEFFQDMLTPIPLLKYTQVEYNKDIRDFAIFNRF